MAYPVIILGAGASLDYIRTPKTNREPRWCPPKTDGLFEPRFEQIIARHQAVSGISAIANELAHGQSLELVMNRLLQKGDHHRLRSFVALQFYLQELFEHVTQKYGEQSGNNYRALIDLTRDHSPTDACFINFNYDLLLEKELHLPQDEVSSYVRNDYKVIKIHGAYNWKRIIPKGPFGYDGIKNSYDYLLQTPEQIKSFTPVKNDRDIHITTEYSRTQGDQSFLFAPYIAVPITREKRFLLPDNHRSVMRTALSQMNKLIVIGWKATDPYLLEELKQCVNQPVDVAIVTGTKEGAANTTKLIQGASDHLRVRTPVTGNHAFSDFVKGSIESVYSKFLA